jgi:transposase
METMERERRPRRSFSKEFKKDAVDLERSSHKTVAEVARDVDLTESALREWVRQADIDDGRRDGLTTAEREELARLRKENRVLREERDILKRATAFMRTARLCRTGWALEVVGADQRWWGELSESA